MAENLLRPDDAGIGGAPDLFRAAARAAFEEIGVELDDATIEFTAFGVQPERCDYNVIGWVRIPHTCEQVEELRVTAVPKDKWENRQLHFIRAEPENLGQFLLQTRGRWSAMGLAAVMLSMYQLDFPRERVRSSFSD